MSPPPCPWLPLRLIVCDRMCCRHWVECGLRWRPCCPLGQPVTVDVQVHAAQVPAFIMCGRPKTPAPYFGVTFVVVIVWHACAAAALCCCCRVLQNNVQCTCVSRVGVSASMWRLHTSVFLFWSTLGLPRPPKSHNIHPRSR